MVGGLHFELMMQQAILAFLLAVGLHGLMVHSACMKFPACSIGTTELSDGDSETYNCAVYTCAEGEMSVCSDMMVYAGYDTQNCIQVFNYDACNTTLINFGGGEEFNCDENATQVLSNLNCSDDGICEPIE